MPVGIKDIFDTGDMPTEFGSPLWAGRTPRRDAAAVARLRAAGAVIMGKTVTTEYAYLPPRQDPEPARSASARPGGSSSGSAAAVAAAMVPGAIGSQTNGSVIRPAAFCGVVGFKPTHGLIPRSGALLLSRTLDHVGVFARTVEDAALLAETLAGFDEEDPDTRPIARPPFAAVAASEPPLPPRFAFVRSPAWEHAEPVTARGVRRAGRGAGRGRRARSSSAPASSARSTCTGRSWKSRWRTISIATTSRAATSSARRCASSSSAGATYPAIDYTARGRRHRRRSTRRWTPVFDEYDAILTPAAPGEAPRGLDSTGNPVFCTTWTYLGTPAVTLPLLQSEAGLPLGVQLVGRRGNDARLLRTARWLVKTVGRGARRRGRKTAATAKAEAPRSRKGKRHDDDLDHRHHRHRRLVAFLGIMVWWVKALPLIIIVVGVLAAPDLRLRAGAALRRERRALKQKGRRDRRRSRSVAACSPMLRRLRRRAEMLREERKVRPQARSAAALL